MGLKHHTKTRDKDEYIAQRKSAMNGVANRCSALVIAIGEPSKGNILHYTVY